MFAGKDFLKMSPPPGYRPGIGRGAVGFTTERERPFPAATKRPANGRPPAGPQSDRGRFDDADEADGEVWDAIESRRKRKRKLPSRPPAASNEPEKPKELSTVSIDEWAKLPDATDTTRTNKRLRETDQSMRRTYAPPVSREPASSASLRPVLEKMIQNQPHNPEGYLRLARLEQEANRTKQARQIVERGTLRAPRSVDLWLASIELHPELSQARQVAAKACRTLPENEELWLAALRLEPTRALKRQLVHEALLACPSGARLWMQAADLEDSAETKQDVLQTAAEFVDSPALWLELGRVNPAHLTTARTQFPANREIWLASIEQDPTLIPQAVTALPRSDWLAFLSGLTPESSLLSSLVKSLELTIEEAKSLPHVYPYMEPSVALYRHWAAESPEILREAVQKFPEDETLLVEFITFVFEHASANAEQHKADWATVVARRMSVSLEVLEHVADLLLKRHEYGRARQWLDGRALSPALWLQYIAASDADAEQLIDEGLERFPGCAAIYLKKAEKSGGDATEILKNGLKQASGTDRAELLLAIADREPSTPRRRALLAQASAQHPEFAPLWLARVQLERNDAKPVAHILSDALKRFPNFAPLWLEDLLSTQPAQRKRRLAEAVRQTGGNKKVLLYGAMYFASVGNTKVSNEWLARAGHSEADLHPNPFT